jgi:RNA polymerase sigma-70 factor (ECF subfamily)
VRRLQDVEWSQLLEWVADTPEEREGPPSADDVWHEILQRLRSLAAMNNLGRFGLTVDDTEDLVQNILVSLLRENSERLVSIRAARAPNAYLVRLIRNSAIDFARKRLREPTVTLETDKDVAASAPETTFSELISDLDESDRKILRLKFVEGLNLSEIARDLGITYSAAGSRVFRLMAILRARYQVEFGGE